MRVFQHEGIIARLCRESGRWRLLDREGDCYWVRANDGSPLQAIGIRYVEGMASVAFQSLFPMRFSLEDPPSGLFARLLMRSFALVYASWTMDIGERCEATLRVVARVPTESLSPALFDFICREMRDEIVRMKQELLDKFHYTLGDGDTAPARPGREAVLPLRRAGDSGQDIVWLGE